MNCFQSCLFSFTQPCDLRDASELLYHRSIFQPDDAFVFTKICNQMIRKDVNIYRPYTVFAHNFTTMHFSYLFSAQHSLQAMIMISIFFTLCWYIQCVHRHNILLYLMNAHEKFKRVFSSHKIPLTNVSPLFTQKMK